MRNTFVYSNQMNTIPLISGGGREKRYGCNFFWMIAQDGNFKSGKYVARNYATYIQGYVLYTPTCSRGWSSRTMPRMDLPSMCSGLR